MLAINKRQLLGILDDGISCNIGRLKAASGTSAGLDSISELEDALPANAPAALKNQVKSCKENMQKASDAIGRIKDALLSGDAPNEADRDETEAGLKGATADIAKIVTNPTITGDADLQEVAEEAQSKIAKAGEGGTQVLEEC
ncbi:hypothetical protein HK099_003051 [Clydaea vesicula]|uniref:Uncharacterized protein n=1 Tax=Clydaea vesicula TaxID=447962 RepID=A0AAD5U250_9FUNG|nr:hypothetical protein HK099_003051 [Clydaea vesicula]